MSLEKDLAKGLGIGSAGGIIAECISALIKEIFDAFLDEDPSKMKKITDILPSGSLKSRMMIEHQKEITKRHTLIKKILGHRMTSLDD